MTSVQALEVARTLTGNKLFQFLRERSLVVSMWVIKELNLSDDDQYLLVPFLQAIVERPSGSFDLRTPLEEKKGFLSIEQLVKEAIDPHAILKEQVQFAEKDEQIAGRSYFILRKEFSGCLWIEDDPSAALTEQVKPEEILDEPMEEIPLFHEEDYDLDLNEGHSKLLWRRIQNL